MADRARQVGATMTAGARTAGAWLVAVLVGQLLVAAACLVCAVATLTRPAVAR